MTEKRYDAEAVRVRMNKEIERSRLPGIDHRLSWMLRVLGDEFGPMGVALVAAQLTDKDVLIHRLTVPQDVGRQPSCCGFHLPRAVREGSALMRHRLGTELNFDGPAPCKVPLLCRLGWHRSTRRIGYSGFVRRRCNYCWKRLG